MAKKKNTSKKARKPKIVIDSWQDCYPSNWQGKIIKESTAHPAKYSSKLIFRIYDHLLETGWVEKGDKVIDPFAGVGLGALRAIQLGLNWTGIELEKRWAELAFESYPCPGFDKDFWIRFNQRPEIIQFLRSERRLCPACESRLSPDEKRNKKGFITERRIPFSDQHVYRGNIPAWLNQFRNIPGVGNAQLFNGDSRKMSQILAGSFTAALGSPPYADSLNAKSEGGIDWGKAGRPDRLKTKGKGIQGANNHIMAYSQKTPGQLGNMPGFDFSAAIASPPFLQTSGGLTDPKPGGVIDQALHKRHSAGNKHADAYGENNSQLTNMPEGDFQQAISGELFDASLSSPPYADDLSLPQAKRDYSKLIEHLERNHNRKMKRAKDLFGAGVYGATEGQLGKLPVGDFEVSLSSPPYAGMEITQQTNFKSKKYPAGKDGRIHKNDGAAAYGPTAGQLGRLPEGAAEISGSQSVAISSPPFENSISGETVNSNQRRKLARRMGFSNAEYVSPIDSKNTGLIDAQPYGVTAGNIGNDSGETFWSAARSIVEQVYINLKPGGHAVWVVKDYVRDWKIVPFCDQWRMLCEAVGFVTLHEHHAELNRHKGTQHKLDGGVHTEIKSSKGFFRRLRESKGSPAIDYEVVFCMMKPEAE